MELLGFLLFLEVILRAETFFTFLRTVTDSLWESHLGGSCFGGLVVLVAQQSNQEGDVSHGQAEDLILAQLFIRRVCGNKLP